MPMLGLGLSINKINPALFGGQSELEKFIAKLKVASCTMALLPQYADGKNPGINVPFTDLMVDISNEVGTNIANTQDISRIGGIINLVSNILTLNPMMNMLDKPIWSNFKENTQYTLSFESKRIDGGSTPSLEWTVYYTDLTTESFTTPQSTTYQSLVFTSEIGKTIDRIEFSVTIQGRALDIKDLMLNEGTVGLAYERYTRNDAVLKGYAETIESGYDVKSFPNGNKTVTVNDGLNDAKVVLNSPGIDPVGDIEVAFIAAFTTESSLDIGYIYCKNEASSSQPELEYALLTHSDDSLKVYLAGLLREVTFAGLIPSTTYVVGVKYIGGRVKIVLNKVETDNYAESLNFTSTPNLTLMARSSAVDNSTQAAHSNCDFGAMLMFNNGITGLNESEIDSILEDIENMFI